MEFLGQNDWTFIILVDIAKLIFLSICTSLYSHHILFSYIPLQYNTVKNFLNLAILIAKKHYLLDFFYHGKIYIIKLYFL